MAPSGLFVRVDGERLTWTRGAPKFFVSSNVAKRGFCADCGTPLTWEYEGWLDLTVASFDEAGKIEPVVQMALDEQYPWLWRLDAIAVRDQASDPEYATYLTTVRSFQHPDHDTEVWPPQEACDERRLAPRHAGTAALAVLRSREDRRHSLGHLVRRAQFWVCVS